MDYEQAQEWVHSLPRLAAHPGVENTRRLLEKLGNPEKASGSCMLREPTARAAQR